MSPDPQLVANVKAIVSPFIVPGRVWYWEQALVSVARNCFRVADAPGGNAPLTVVAYTSAVTVAGTGSPEWNDAILAAGRRVRARENPHPGDYSHRNYASDSSRTQLARLMAVSLLDEAATRGLSTNVASDARRPKRG